MTTQATATTGTVASFAINEKTHALTFLNTAGNALGHVYMTDFMTPYGYTAHTLARTQAGMNLLDSIYLPRTTDTHSRLIPSICIDIDGGAGNTTTDVWRGYYSGKRYVNGGAVAGNTIYRLFNLGLTVTTTTDLTASNFI